MELPIGFGVVNATSDAISASLLPSLCPCCPVMTLVPANKHTDKSSGLEQINKGDVQIDETYWSFKLHAAKKF